DDCSDTHVGVRLADFCARYEQVTYVRRTENGGFIEACYTGLEEAAPESNLLLLNSDVVLPVDAVKKMKAAVKDNPDIALASPLSTGSYTLALQLVPGHSLEELNQWMTKEVTPRFPTVITPEGQCLFISRDAINRFGFFDRVYERGFCEESDFGMRVALHGGRLACFDSFVVFHEQSASFHHKVRDVLYEKNRSLFEARWGDYFSYLAKFHQITPKLDELRNAYDSAFQGDYPRPSEGHKIEDVLGGTLQKSVVKRGAERAMSLPEDSDIVFVLPSVVRGGGSLSVLQHANEMALRGERVKVISLSPVGGGIYPSLVEVLDITPEGLLELPWSEQRLIATFWSTSYPVAEVCRRNPRVQGWYYIQDYEPWFHHGHSDVVQAAEKSYELGLQMVAKTGFLKTLIEERHNVRVHKISPGIATDVFYPGQQEKNAGRPKVAALYRPETPRRGSRELLEVIEVAHKMMPELEFTLFGSTGGLPQKLVGSVRLAGKISQRDVAELYRTTDIVVDLSHWHGFGRMGIEAMAAGAVPVLSDSGGIHEYAINGENSIICDPSNPYKAAEAICNLALDREYRLRLREMGISTAEKLTESRATDDWLNLLNNNQRASSGIHCTSTRGAYSHG
ncbi:glycosyltransferase, partial [bacterium]|nr:glycosyltransferase [bacterium]